MTKTTAFTTSPYTPPTTTTSRRPSPPPSPPSTTSGVRITSTLPSTAAPAPQLPRLPVGVPNVIQLNHGLGDLLNPVPSPPHPVGHTSTGLPAPTGHPTYPGNHHLKPSKENGLEYQPVQPLATHPTLPTTTNTLPSSTTTGGVPVVTDDDDVDELKNPLEPQRVPLQTVFVSSLGELSTDINSGFDINKSRFLVVDSEETQKKQKQQQLQQEDVQLAVEEEEEEPERTEAEQKLLVDLLEEQVSLLGQAVNGLNGLTRPEQFSTKPGSRFLPRIIASNVIVPLPKGFQKQTVARDFPELISPTIAARTLTTATAAGQFPTEQFSFPAGQVSPPPSPSAHPVLIPLPSHAPTLNIPLLPVFSSPGPFTAAPQQLFELAESGGGLSSVSGFGRGFAAGHLSVAQETHPAAAVVVEAAVPTQSSFVVNDEVTTTTRREDVQETTKKQIFTYPQVSEGERRGRQGVNELFRCAGEEGEVLPSICHLVPRTFGFRTLGVFGTKGGRGEEEKGNHIPSQLLL